MRSAEEANNLLDAGLRVTLMLAPFRTAARRFRPLLEDLKLVRQTSFGLNGLDRKLLPYIKKRRGVFIEAGANNGLRQSNTAYLEFYLGWNGLLVEPIPELAQECRWRRPASIVEQCALVPGADAPATVEMTYCNLMSIVDGARGSPELDETHIERGRQFLKQGDEPRKVQVPTASLSSLLIKHGITTVDLLSLDVEGYEEQALRGLDLQRHAPTWILVEANDPNAIQALLGTAYRLVDTLSHHDHLYRLAS